MIAQSTDFADTPYYGEYVPKHPARLLTFREMILRDGYASNRNAEDLWIMCKRDLLFWLNTFGWIFEPRSAKVVPFNTYAFQDDALRAMNRRLGRGDIGVVKSRDMGASWMCLALFTWRWLFHPMQKFLLVSRNADLVDATGNSDTLFWKVDFLVKNQPEWLVPTLSRSLMHLHNEDSGSTVDGASTTGNVGRGGRRLGVLMDEFAAVPAGDDVKALAATQYVADTRIFLSTPQGDGNAFAHVLKNQTDIEKIKLPWSDHPVKRRGLYRAHHDGRVDRLDPAHRFPATYPFVHDGKLRSVYYDNECRRCPIPRLIAQELDMNFGASVSLVFDTTVIERARKEHVRHPFHRGRLAFDFEKFMPTWVDSENGPLLIWCHLDAKGKPPAGQRYVVGCDIAAGTEGELSSNSAAVVLDVLTGEQVAEFTTFTDAPTQFAQQCVVLAKWFNGAKLNWEANGCFGETFRKEVQRLEYTNVWYREVQGTNFTKRTKKPGWFSGEGNKHVLLDEVQMAVGANLLILRSGATVEEFLQFRYKDGRIIHSGAAHAFDDSARGKAHGDRAIAAAVAWQATGGRKLRQAKVTEEHQIVGPPPTGSMAHRFWEIERRQAMNLAEQW